MSHKGAWKNQPVKEDRDPVGNFEGFSFCLKRSSINHYQLCNCVPCGDSIKIIKGAMC